jgi:predicted small secreted protein
MKKLLLTFLVSSLLLSCNTVTKTETTEDIKSDKNVKIHEGSFAFCGASGAIPTGKKIIVQGKEYDEGCAICPVLDGPSISNLAMNGISGTYGKFNVS